MLCVRGTHARGFCFSDDLYQIASPTAARGCCSPKSIPAEAFTNWSPNSTATAAISASATTTTDCRTAFTTAAAYCRSTPTKAATPISTPTKTATNPWRKSSITTKTKRNTSPISTTTKSASRARLPTSMAIFCGTANIPPGVV